MVFSGGNEEASSAIVSKHGSTSLSIKSTPIRQGTTAKDYVVFDVEVELNGVTKDVAEILLANLKSEINSKVNTLLIPFTGRIDDDHPPNRSGVSTLGIGSVTLTVLPNRTLANTFDPNKVIFKIKIYINSCTRWRLINILQSLDQEIMDKINDSL